jgi:hypothetical protein
LEYASADLAHPFAREIANLARAVAKAAEEGKEGTMRSNPPPVMSRPEADDLNQDTQMNAWYKVGDHEMVEFYSDDWSTILFPPLASGQTALGPHHSGTMFG